MLHSPLEQFNLAKLLNITVKGWDLSITTQTLYLIIVILSITLLLTLTTNFLNLSLIDLSKVILFQRASELILESFGLQKGKSYIPFIFALFLFILFSNLIGLIPYSTTISAQASLTLFLSGAIFIGVTTIALKNHGFSFINYFIPSGIPAFLVPLLFVIEIISYLSRIISLSVRLFANMTSGHVLLKIITIFGLALPSISVFIPIPVIIALYTLDLGVSVIQAYVFSVLTVIYIRDMENPSLKH